MRVNRSGALCVSRLLTLLAAGSRATNTAAHAPRRSSARRCAAGRNPTASRFSTALQVAFLHDLAAGRLRAFASGTLKDEKPDMDFEGGVEWRAPRGTVRAVVGALDVFSDFITQTLGVDYVTDSITDYTTHPFSARLTLDLAIARGWRVEAYGFVMTPSTVGLTLASDPGSGFTQDERYAYGGALLEWSPTPSSAVGPVATHVRARMDRRPRASSRATDDFELLEQQSQVGAYAMKRVGSRVTTEAWVMCVIRPDERTYRGASAPPSLLYRDRAWVGRVTTTYQAATGFRGDLGLDFVARTTSPSAGPRAYLGDNNGRLRADFGWRFGQRALIVVGSNVDLDKDNGTAIGTFDGAHGRFAIYW